VGAGKSEEHDGRAGRDVDDKVIRGRDDGERHRKG
jgi:hypothetical protein